MSYDPSRSDQWIIFPEDRLKHDAQFNQLKPVAGFLTGEQARIFFLQSGLPTHILSKIWQLSDLNADGRMDRREFSIAMHLIKKTLHGYELPSVLPSSLLLEQPAGLPLGTSGVGISSVGVPGMGVATMGVSGIGGVSAAGAFVPPGVPVSPYMNAAPLPLHAPPVSTVTSGFGNAGMMGPTSFAVQQRPVASSVGGEWCIPQNQRLKYKQLFNNTDVTHKGYLTGLEAKNILSQSGLIHSVLAQIWSLADIDTDGNLSPDEFCVAMYLIDVAKSGQSIPSVLPPDLVPPAYRRIRRPSETASLPPPTPTLVTNISSISNTGPPSLDSFGDLVPGFGLSGMPPIGVQSDAAAAAAAAEAEALKVVTFEDRRKENFEKGQAELERRRAMLREQQQKETEERLAAERAEQEKRERIRQDQEHKKQMEMEKQLEKQRQLEMEREEQRKKAMEQREAARQELERQRQLEWERQRRDQLMLEKQREQSQVDRLRLEVGQLKLELESFEGKKMELFSRAEQVRQNITEFTSAIDAMKVSRDSKLSDIEHFQSEFEEWNMKLVAAQQERLRLGRQVQTPDPAIDDNFRAVETSYRSKKAAVDQLTARLEKVEEEKSGINGQFNESLVQLNEVKNQMNALMLEYTKQESTLNERKKQWDERKDKSRPASVPVQNSKFEVFGFDNENKSTGDSFGSVDWFANFKKEPTTATTASNAAESLDAWGMMSSDAKTTLTNGQDDAWAFGSDASTKESQSSSNAWANFDNNDSFGAVPQSADSSQVNWATDFFPSTAAKSDSTAKKTTVPLSGFRKHIALYQFDARNPDELSLLTGDTVWVKLDQSKAELDWMIGQKDVGPEGCFPAAYVQLATGDIYPEIPSKTASKTKANEPWQSSETSASGDALYDSPLRSSESANGKSLASGQPQQPPMMGLITASAESSFIPVSSSAPVTAPGQALSKGAVLEGCLQVVALYPWQAKKDNHLTFKKGDVITVLDQQDIWWSGQLNGKVGWFPKSYVKVTGGESSALSSVKPNQSSTDNSSMLSAMRPPTPPNGAPTSGFVLENSVQDRLTPLSSSSAQLPETKLSASPGLSGSPASGIKTSPAPTTAAAAESTNASEESVVVAMYTYGSTESNDLSFSQGDVFTVQKMEGDWWTGTFNGKSGIFPASYVRVMENMTPLKLTGNKRPEIASVIAPYQATGQEQLTLQPGQLIHVRKKSASGWWEGELQARGMKRRVGWFPANYVKLLGQGGSVATGDISNSPTSTLKGSSTPTSFSSPAPTNPASIEQVMSVYSYQAQRDDELSFQKGSTINIINKDDNDWWKGEFNGKVGMFPSNYVTALASKDHLAVS